ncbi:MAG: 6-carboxytetrahydropterin synthase QueD [Candidatus Melainabacteria bacterium GWF2_37_15]|nr:MAG: 6-carboxytetrahydropterin synthase QueD [Candidatus Melainabacteria bacterium GWF2_37_15]
MFELSVESHFSSAHRLLNYEGKCENVHGHNWKVEITIAGETLDKSGMLIDFKILKSTLDEVLDKLDHKDLNSLEELKGISPSSENIAKFIYDELKQQLPQLTQVAVWETEKAKAVYRS